MTEEMFLQLYEEAERRLERVEVLLIKAEENHKKEKPHDTRK